MKLAKAAIAESRADSAPDLAIEAALALVAALEDDAAAFDADVLADVALDAADVAEFEADAALFAAFVA